MSNLLKLTGPNHALMIKEAILGKALVGVGSLMGRAGKAVVKNPFRTLGALATGSDMVSRANRMGGAAAAGEALGTGVGRITM
jgi:hypothetical protein